MSRLSMSIYAQRAREMSDPLQAAARYPNQRDGERRAILDIAHKLDLQPTDTLLDIGSGIGSLTIPLSYMVARTDAVDSEECLQAMSQRAPERIHQRAGNFLDLDIPTRFSKILCYDCLHYLKNETEALIFVGKAIALLERGGRALFGDLPNVDMKRRVGVMLQSGMDAEWRSREDALPVDHELVHVDDAFCITLMRACRDMGFNTWLVPQPRGLAFNAREDLLVERI